MLSYRNTIFLLFSIFLLGCGKAKELPVEKGISERRQFKETFHLANSEKIIGHYEKAIVLFEKCLSLEPNNAATNFALSDLYERQGDKQKTLAYAEQAYNLNQKNKWYALRLADLYFEKKEFEKTADLYEQIIAEEKNVDLKFKYVDALINSKRYDKAINMLAEIEVETGKVPEVSFTKHDLYNQIGKSELAAKELSDLIESDPSNADYKIIVAEFYMKEQKFEESKELVNAILKNDPEYGQAYIMLADLDLRQGNVKGTFENLQKGFSSKDVPVERKLEILSGLIPYSAPNQRDAEEMKAGIANLFSIIDDPALKSAEFHRNYGSFYLTHGNFPEAEKQFQLACDYDPSSFKAWIQLLNIQYEIENYSGMAENGETIIELFPAQPVAYLFAGIGAKESGEYEKSEEFFFLGKDLVVKDSELTSEFFYQLGDMNYAQNNPDEGKYYFDQAIQIFPANVNVYADNANRFLEDAKITEAEAEIKKGLSFAEKSAILLDIYGLILIEKKEYKSASEAFENALYENYYDSIIIEHYGDALFLNGEKEKGIELWKEAIKYGNNSGLLKQKLEEKKYYPPQ